MAITISAAKAPSAVNPLAYRLTASETTNGWTNSDNYMALRRISLSSNPLIINQEFNLSFEARITTSSSKGHLRRQHLYLAFFDSDGVNIGSLVPIGNGSITQKVITMDAGSWYRFQVNGLTFDSLQNAKAMRLRFGGCATDDDDAKPSVFVSINMGFDSSGELQRIGTHQSGTSITDANRTAIINYVTTKNIYYAINHNFRINDLTIERNKTSKTTINIEFDVVATCQKDYISESTETYSVFLYKNSVKTGTYSGQISGVAHGQDHTRKFTLSTTLALSSSANYHVVVSDNYGNEVASQIIKVQRGDAIVNLHLCGTSKGGISIGRENTENYSSPSYVPKFESHFPTVFYDGIYGVDNYSLNEVYTGSKWINGKKIYKKTFAKAGVNKNGSTPYTERGRIEDIDEVISIEGIAYTSSCQYPLPYESAASSSASDRFTHGAFIRVTDESNAENHDGIVYYIKQANSEVTNMMATVWYTKTTD